jgi:arylsulfatase A
LHTASNFSKPFFRKKKMKIITTFFVSVISVLGLFLYVTALDAAETERPNIVVLLCDDLGYGDLHCYGNPIIETPNLDRLASEGIRFTDFYSTAPVCSASRAGLLTGRTPSRIGVYDWIPNNHPMHLLKSETTFAAVLKQSGYDTALVGKWHCNGKFNLPEQPQPSDHGFDYWFATQNNAAPSHENPDNFVQNGEKVGQIQGFSCQIVADQAIKWLTTRTNPKRPFCLVVTFHEPHEPIASPNELVQKYKERGAMKSGEAEYYANVENMDRAVGRLVETLKRENLWENTLTIFSSDNGPETLNRYKGSERSHGTPGDLRGMKLWLYEGGYRVPGIAVWQKVIKPNQVSKIPVGAIDLFPTFCNVAGATLPTDRCFDGTNILTVLKGEELQRTKPLFWYYINALGEPRVAIRDGNWKLVATLEGNPRPEKGQGNSHSAKWFETLKTAKLGKFELYHLADDHQEKNELSAKLPEQLEIMKQKMKTLFLEVQRDAPIYY